MRAWLWRVLAGTGSAVLGAALVALLEAKQAGIDGSYLAAAWSLFGVLAPLAVCLGLAFAIGWLVVEPGAPRGPLEWAAEVRRQPVLQRSRTAAVVPLAILAVFGSVVVSANAARVILGSGTPKAAGTLLAVVTLLAGVVALLLVLALTPWLRRLLAHAAESWSALLDPIGTGGVVLLVCAGLFTCGVQLGDTSGEGAFPVGIFGVLKRDELDLRPVSHAFYVALAAYGVTLAMARARRPLGSTAISLALLALVPVATVLASSSLSAKPESARAIAKAAPFGKIGLALLRRAVDRDHDGYAAAFGGGDCDDRDPKRHPDGLDVPGNGIDEDCDGIDTPVATKTAHAVAKRGEIGRPLNVILITIDTLRADVGFLGYPKPVSPNLDKLAAESTIYERAYSLASYTGKSIGPMLIGRYPSETYRDGSHFNTYVPKNVFVTERLKDAGYRTFGCAGHWYFRPWSGLSQGMDTFDVSAIPPGMGDNDDTVTSEAIANVALKMLQNPANTGSKFFMWMHFFDPHMQYVGHPGAPDMMMGATGGAAFGRAAYDGEIWFTDKHIGRVLDYVKSASFANDTAIIVTADHGEAFGEHAMSWHGGELWEPLVHVPLVLYVPGQKARRVAEKRGAIDIAPTILELAGIKIPEELGEIQGTSLLADTLAPPGAALDERDVYLDMPIGPFNGMRRGLLFGKSPGMKVLHFGGAQYSLFDLANDPQEKNDLAKDKELAQEAIKKLATFRAGLKEIEVKPLDH